MGRFQESLKQPASRKPAEAAPARQAAAPEPEREEDVAEEEIPFIEVGPHKSMDASASVLATRPAAPESAPRRNRFAPEVLAYHQPDHAVSGQYRELLVALIPPVADKATPALLLAPASPGVDAAAILVNLAVTAARQGGRRVVVVDADPRNPTVGQRLGLSARPGLSDVLAGGATLEQALQPGGVPNLSALTAGGLALAGPRLVVETPASVLRQVRQRCDLVLVLGPLWDGRPEGPALAAACDRVYLVLPEQDAGSPRLDELLQTVPRLSGCILAA